MNYYCNEIHDLETVALFMNKNCPKRGLLAMYKYIETFKPYNWTCQCNGKEYTTKFYFTPNAEDYIFIKDHLRSYLFNMVEVIRQYINELSMRGLQPRIFNEIVEISIFNNIETKVFNKNEISLRSKLLIFIYKHNKHFIHYSVGNENMSIKKHTRLTPGDFDGEDCDFENNPKPIWFSTMVQALKKCKFKNYSDKKSKQNTLESKIHLTESNSKIRNYCNIITENIGRYIFNDSNSLLSFKSKKLLIFMYKHIKHFILHYSLVNENIYIKKHKRLTPCDFDGEDCDVENNPISIRLSTIVVGKCGLWLTMQLKGQ